MNTQFKNRIKTFAPAFVMLMAMFILGYGCNTSKLSPDPLVGFHAASKNPEQVIVDDYQNYIKSLSPEEKTYMGPTQFFEDGTGQHAVRIEVDLGGKDAWYHVLFYDKDNKRTKVIIYFKGKYMS